MRNQIAESRRVQGLVIQLQCSDGTLLDVASCIVNRRLVLLSDGFRTRNWLGEHKDEIQIIVERSMGKLKGTDVYENSHH